MDTNNSFFKEQVDNTSSEIEELQNRLIEEDEDSTSSVVPPADIVAFNEQRSCADIYRMYYRKQLDLNPDFQRGEVWSNKAQTLFVDSLIKQLPIPSMCISLDISTQKRLVIDGLQRITTIVKFLDTNNKWRLSKTDDVDIRLSGKTNCEIQESNVALFDILENVTIPITVLRCDYTKSEHMKYLFQIFYRLNSGGNKLYNQEIRNCIYQGSFNSLLKELALSNDWLQFANTTEEKVKRSRFNNEERILRFFAFNERFEEYKGKLALFLNDYMNDYKNATLTQIEELRTLFINTMGIVNKIQCTVSSKNVADALLVGISQNYSNLCELSVEDISLAYRKLQLSEEFSEESLKEGLGATDKVKDRIKKAIEVFKL